MLNIRRLRYFVKAVENGSLKEAASLLSISQQVLLKQMEQLETELHRKLYLITNDRIIVTSNGKDIFKAFCPIFYQLEKAIGNLVDQTINI